MPASAATTDTTEATVTISGGDLAMSAPTTAPFIAVSPGADATFSLASISVTDTRAGIAGWETTASLTDFVGENDQHIIAKANATYDPSVTGTTGDATFSDVGAVSLGAPALVETASEVTGNNSATWTAALSLAVPANALADTYTATLTHSVV